MSQNENKPGEDAFQALIGDLGTMAKSMDEAAAAAAAEEGDGKIAAAAEGEEGDGTGGPAKVGDDGKAMTKSIMVKLADGTEMEAQDGTELVKALQEQVSGLEGVMAKALGSAVELIRKQGEAITANAVLVKSLQTKVAELSNQPAGRKTVLTVHEKPAGTLAKSDPQGISETEFMAKATTAFHAGKITGLDISIAETSINRGQAIPPDIITRVLS